MRSEQSSQQSETKTYNLRWMLISIIGSLVLSASAIAYSLHIVEQAKGNSSKAAQVYQIEIRNTAIQLDDIERNYQQAKISLLTQIGANSALIDQDLLADVKTSLQAIEMATQTVRSAIMAQPENPSLYHLLNSIYQQELEVLTQLSKLNSLS